MGAKLECAPLDGQSLPQRARRRSLQAGECSIGFHAHNRSAPISEENFVEFVLRRWYYYRKWPRGRRAVVCSIGALHSGQRRSTRTRSCLMVTAVSNPVLPSPAKRAKALPVSYPIVSRRLSVFKTITQDRLHWIT